MPSDEASCGAGQLTIAELPAAQVKVTVTLLVFQPLALAPGEAATVMVGGAAVALTLKLAAFIIPPSRAEIVVLPLATPVLRPPAEIVAMPGLVELQVTAVVMSWLLPSL